MYWLARPPYLRWLVAVLVVVLSLINDVRTMLSVEHPFAAGPLAAGTTVRPEDVVMARVPAGLLPPVALPLRLVHPVGAGEPLTPSLASDPVSRVPAGWVGIALEVPGPVSPGDELLLIGTSDDGGADLAVDGRVVSVQPEDGFSPAGALVAIPREAAAGVAAARLEGRLTVLSVVPRG
jgi:hypothetical protein